jgi:hypothetical protein
LTRASRAAALLLCVALTGPLAACGAGGFGSTPPPPPDRTIHRYVALGDGFTAAPYTGRTTGDDGCLRSAHDYPALAAARLRIATVHDVSCTHATAEALTRRFEVGNGKPPRPAQLDAVTRDTDLVSISAGIEDHDLLHEMFRICVEQPCRTGTVFYAKVLQDVTHAVDALTAAIREVQAKAPGAYIVVLGYPRLTPSPGKSCQDFPAQDAQGDSDVVGYVLGQLNGEIRSAAQQTGSAYVDVAALSSGHELCSAHPWVHSMTDDPGTAVAYHPLEAEQRAVADQLVAQVEER